ncbi:hypothetical protein [Streptomyces sp. NBC_01508]|uniref:hypothetical protein n=1 Tax=Streptomyces sp. NBC_01508 TaxID=2903888 RepID=UPI003869207D
MSALTASRLSAILDAAVATAGSWRQAFTAMLQAVLADAERFGAKLPVSVERVRTSVRGAAPALDEVTVPALVHFDLGGEHPAGRLPGGWR